MHGQHSHRRVQVFCLVGLSCWLSAAGRAAAQADGSDVQRRIESTVRELGVLESQASTELRSPAEGVLLTLAPEGRTVRKGDLVAQIDPSPLEAKVLTGQIEVQQAKARLSATRAELEQADVQRIGHERLSRLRVAMLEKEQQALGQEGELSLQQKEVEAKVNASKAKIKALEAAFAREQQAGRAASDVEAALTEQREVLKVALARQQWLQGPAAELQELRSQVALAEVKLEAVTAAAKYEQAVASLRAALAAAEAQLQQAESQLAEAQEALAGCALTAPHDGVVLHVAVGRGASPLEEGATLRQRQPVVRIADPQQLVAHVNVNETRIAHVRVGQRATISPDALPQAKIAGRVAKVSQAANPASWPRSDVRNYSVVVALEETPAALRLGMTVQVEIQVGREGRK